MAEMDEVKDMSGIEVMKGIMTGMKKGVRKENEAFSTRCLGFVIP